MFTETSTEFLLKKSVALGRRCIQTEQLERICWGAQFQGNLTAGINCGCFSLLNLSLKPVDEADTVNLKVNA